MAVALRLAAERVLGMEIRVVVDVNEGLERDGKPLAVVENSPVVVRNAPRAGIEIKPLVEFATLREPAKFGVRVAAAQGPAAPADAVVVFEDLNPVAGLLQLISRDEAREPRTYDEHGCALHVSIELDRAPVGRLRGMPKRGHRLVHRGRTAHG